MTNIFTTVPNFSLPPKQGQLSLDQITKFFNQGFLVLNNIFSSEELEHAKEDTAKLVDNLAQRLFKADLHEDADLFRRTTLLHKEFPGFTVLLCKENKLTDSYKKLYTNERMLNIVEQLVGPNISTNSVWNLRPKTPSNESHDVPWHQDNGYCSPESDQSLVITAWVPLLDATPQNGCLEFLRGGHRKGVCAKHQGCWASTWYIELVESEIKDVLDCDPTKDAVVCPVPYGSTVIFNNLCPHRSLPNMSDEIRWSLDLRWQCSDFSSGFDALPNCVKLRVDGEPDFEPDWKGLDQFDRAQALSKATEGNEFVDDEFDVIVTGPWMLRWPISHHNEHTSRLLKSD